MFSPTLFLGRMHFHRDVATVYYPDYVFLARSLAQGIWPLWHPAADAGAPFFMPYPVTVLLVALFGARGALAVAPPLHVLLAMSGATLLSRARGTGPWGAWAAGAVLGLSGYVQSTLLYPVFLALAWAPLILWSWWRLQEEPSGGRAASLGLFAALQVSTFGGEVVAQTALLALLLRPPRVERRRLTAALGSAALSVLLAAPVLLGAREMLQGTSRGAGFSAQEALSFSAPPPVLLEALLPRFLGDVHRFTDLGFWGQPFFPEGYPFLLSLYLGPAVFALVLLAGRDRLWIAGVLGLFLSLGEHGPLASALTLGLKVFRVPIKFFFLTTFAAALLAGRGVDRMLSRERRPSPLVLLPCLSVLALAALAGLAPETALGWLRWWQPEIGDWRPRAVVFGMWPEAFRESGLLALASLLALFGARRLRPLAAVVAVVDLLVVNAPLNPAAPPAFYELRGETRDAVRSAEREGRFRWFSAGLTATPALRFSPAIVAANNDVWLYALERQALLPRMHVLDGLEGALDEDRTGLLPAGAALPASLRDPARIGEYLGRLRVANVRWVLSWRELPAAHFVRRATVRHPEILDPMGIYELRDPLPRAYWVGRAEVLKDAARRWARLEETTFDPSRVVLLSTSPPGPMPALGQPGSASVVYEAVDPHTVRLRVDSPPGFVVVLDGFHRGWLAEGPHGLLPVLEANGRYRAIPTPGGHFELTLRYRPSWLRPALTCVLVGLLLILAISRPIKVFHPRST